MQWEIKNEKFKRENRHENSIQISAKRFWKCFNKIEITHMNKLSDLDMEPKQVDLLPKIQIENDKKSVFITLMKPIQKLVQNLQKIQLFWNCLKL